MHGEIAKLVAEHYDKMPFGFPHNEHGHAIEYFDWAGWTDDEGKVFTDLAEIDQPVTGGRLDCRRQAQDVVVAESIFGGAADILDVDRDRKSVV